MSSSIVPPRQVLSWLAASLSAAVVLAMPAAWAAAPGQAWPQRPVRMVVPFAPGGASDFVGRIIQPRLSAELGQTVVIDNRTGAAGNIGVEVAAMASPDGYTVLLGNVGTMAINPSLYPKFPHHPTRSLVPISQVVDVPGSLVIHPSVPATSVKELVALLRAHPDKYNFASSGAGSANRLETELLMRATGTRMVHVPFKGGAGPAAASLIGGETQVAFLTLSSTVNFARQGKLRLLGVVAPTRVVGLPDVQTMVEAGFPDMKIGSWQGIFVPRGTPVPVVTRLFEAVQKAMAQPDVAERLLGGGVAVVTSESPGAFRTFVDGEIARFGKVIRDAKITDD
jgi:tripartite-type tricarboxylate transporter receptor subunit TctC